MAIITATITVDFIANYVGDHRVCWRIQGSGSPYDCSTIVNCVGGGAACQAIITADVNDTSCDGDIIFEGYVQSGCETEPSFDGRIPWSATFTPVVTCLRQELLCLYGGIVSVIPTVVGYHYTLADTINIIRDGSDAQVDNGTLSIGTVGDGIITSVDPLLNQGTGYVVNDVLNIVDGIGAGTGAQITVNTIGGLGEITAFTLTNPGTDYVGNLTLAGGAGSGAILGVVTFKVFGSILSLLIGIHGKYEIIPTITITTANGMNAAIDVELESCATFVNIGTDCNAVNIDITNKIEVGSVFAVCSPVAIVPPNKFQVTQIGCCVAEDSASDVCFDYTFNNTSLSGVSIDVVTCGGDYQLQVVPASTSIQVCLIEGGYADPEFTGFTITQGAACS